MSFPAPQYGDARAANRNKTHQRAGVALNHRRRDGRRVIIRGQVPRQRRQPCVALRQSAIPQKASHRKALESVSNRFPAPRVASPHASTLSCSCDTLKAQVSSMNCTEHESSRCSWLTRTKKITTCPPPREKLVIGTAVMTTQSFRKHAPCI